MPDETSYADIRAQIQQRAVIVYGTCTEDELTVLCRLVFWVLTATDEALARVESGKLAVVHGLFQAELAALSEVTTRLAEEARSRGLTDEMIGPLLEAQVYRDMLRQPYPPQGDTP
jgi:hypothetical protein